MTLIYGTIFDILLTVFDFYLLYVFLKSFLGNPRIDRKYFYIFMAVYTAVISVINLFENAFMNICTVFILCIIISFFFHKEFKVNLLVSGFYLVIVSLNEIVVGMILMRILEQYDLFSDKYEYDFHFNITIIIIKLTKFTIIMLISKYKGYYMNSMPRVFNVTLFTIPVASCLVAVSTIDSYYDMNPDYIVIRFAGLIGILYINVIIFIIFEKVNKLSRENIENKLLEQEIKYKDEYYRNVEANQEKLKEVRHNLKNQLLGVKHVLMESEDSDVKSLLAEIDIDENIYTENPIVNHIVDSKITMAKKNHIIIKDEIRIPDKLKANSGDLGIIIGNLLDNAVEANIKISSEHQRYIDLNIGYINKCLIIEVSNPFPVKKENFTYHVSSKPDAENHGIGLKSVRKIVEKYDGNIDIQEEEQFVVNILLMNV